jgi:hypothetical protein
MYKYKDKDIVSLSVNFRDLVPSSEDITQDELRLVTSDAKKENLSKDELSGLKKRFKKIHYTILDLEQNRKGFGVTEEGMQVFVDHFNATKNDKDLHNFFKDHDYGKIDSMLGRIVDTRYDNKNKRVRRTALIDLRHPTAQRLDMFQNLSTTLLHGKPVCSECEQTWMSCGHTDSFPKSTVAYGIEDSLVTQSAYPNAKRDSLGMFQSSLSGIDIAEDYFNIDNLSAIAEEEAKRIAIQEEEQKRVQEEERVKAETDRSAEETRKLKAEEEKQKEEIETREINEIKETVKFVKEIIEKGGLD